MLIFTLLSELFGTPFENIPSLHSDEFLSFGEFSHCFAFRLLRQVLER